MQTAQANHDTRPSKGPITHADPTAPRAKQVASAKALNAEFAAPKAKRPYVPGEYDAAPKVVRQTKETPAEKHARQAATLAAETMAARANAAAIANHKQSTAPKPAAKKTGSGALVGVADGAMDGQPHTKLAVEQARKRLLEEARAAVKGPLVDAKGRTVLNATRANEARKDALAIANGTKQAPAPRAKPAPQAKAVKGPRVATDRDYKAGKVEFDRKAGTWTHYMVTLALKHTSTAAANAAHAKCKDADYAKKALDFKWMDAKGFIALK